MRAAIPLLLFMTGVQGWVLSLPLFGPVLFKLAAHSGQDPVQTASLFFELLFPFFCPVGCSLIQGQAGLETAAYHQFHQYFAVSAAQSIFIRSTFTRMEPRLRRDWSVRFASVPQLALFVKENDPRKPSRLRIRLQWSSGHRCKLYL